MYTFFIQGLLAGIWPCGIITLIEELYKSESKAQVYGCLHGFIYNNAVTAGIGKNCLLDSSSFMINV